MSAVVFVSPEIPPPAGVDTTAWNAAIAAIRNYCGWHVAPETTETVTVDGSGNDTLLLPTLHLSDLIDVINDGQPVTDPEWSKSGIVRGCWTGKYQGVTVTMTHGLTAMPAEVLAIAADMAKSGGRVGATSQQTGPFQVSYGTGTAAFEAGVVGLSSLQKQILDTYRLPPRP